MAVDWFYHCISLISLCSPSDCYSAAHWSLPPSLPFCFSSSSSSLSLSLPCWHECSLFVFPMHCSTCMQDRTGPEERDEQTYAASRRRFPLNTKGSASHQKAVEDELELGHRRQSEEAELRRVETQQLILMSDGWHHWHTYVCVCVWRNSLSFSICSAYVHDHLSYSRCIEKSLYQSISILPIRSSAVLFFFDPFQSSIRPHLARTAISFD